MYPGGQGVYQLLFDNHSQFCHLQATIQATKDWAYFGFTVHSDMISKSMPRMKVIGFRSYFRNTNITLSPGRVQMTAAAFAKVNI